jgi:FtsZ-binding cell division protein ZapB
LQQLTDLEQKVEQLIRAIATQEENHTKLRQENLDLHEELRSRAESEKHYAEERVKIRSKIDNLLGKLEDISDVT